MLYSGYKHSAFSGNLWLASQSCFLWRYAYRNWGKDNARVMMGKIAERVARIAVEQEHSPEWASTEAETQLLRFTQGEVTKETEKVGPITAAFVRALSELGFPLPKHEREAITLPGLRHKVAFELDFAFGNFGIVDTKATLQMKDKASPDHLRQCGFYHKATKLPVSLLYATNRKSWLYPIKQHELDEGFAEIFAAWQQIERWQEKFPTPEEAIPFVPLNTDSFYWDADEIPKAKQLWRQVNGGLSQAA